MLWHLMTVKSVRGLSGRTGTERPCLRLIILRSAELRDAGRMEWDLTDYVS